MRAMVLSLALLSALPAWAQEAAPEPAPPPAEAAPKPRPKPKHKPAATKPAPVRADPAPVKPDAAESDLSTLDLGGPQGSKPATSNPETGTAEPVRDLGASVPPPSGTPTPPAGNTAPAASDARREDARQEKARQEKARKESETSSAARTQFAPPPAPPPQPLPAAPPAATPLPAQGAIVACDAGQSVLYDEPNGFSFWVTRSGTITIDNPLRPLTPDVTRVLLLVIADKLATAYGPDLTVLSRGGVPAALEGRIGGPIRWEAGLGILPDGLEIVTDTGAPLARMRFKECGTAPVVKAPAPVAGRDQKARGRKAAAGRPQPVPAPEPVDRPASLGAAQAGAPAPRRFNLPQGAIPE